MKNILEEPYRESPEQRLRSQLLNRNKNNIKSNKIKLDPDQKRKLNTLDPIDRLHYLRNLGYSRVE